MIAPNFIGVKTGTIVTRSAHWYTERGKPVRTDEIGILTGIDLYGQVDETGTIVRVVAWPIIHWENGIFATSVHPVNTDIFRPEVRASVDYFDYDDSLELKSSSDYSRGRARSRFARYTYAMRGQFARVLLRLARYVQRN